MTVVVRVDEIEGLERVVFDVVFEGVCCVLFAILEFGVIDVRR